MVQKIPSIDDVWVIETNGEWPTKSGGNLSILLRIDFALVESFLTYDPDELKNVTFDIRGLRSYMVKNVPKGSIGANEWHKIRNEIVYCLEGSFDWECKDVYGNYKKFTLDKNSAIMTPHHILHTYTALEDNSCIAVLANTLFLPNKPETHDTYRVADFPSAT